MAKPTSNTPPNSPKAGQPDQTAQKREDARSARLEAQLRANLARRKAAKRVAGETSDS